MKNEKSVYEMRLEDKDKIIDFQQNIINKLIKTNVLTALILAIIICVFTISYFWSDYEFFTNSNNTTITGDSNTNVKDSSLKNSEMNLE